MTRASVVLCTYNRSASLARTLESLRALRLDAGLRPELIVVDNNSTDATRAVVMDAAARSSWPIRYAFEPMQGLSHARNHGLSLAAGEWVAFTDDDVIVDADWLAHLAAAFRQYQADGVGGPIDPRWECPPPEWVHCANGGAVGRVDYGPEAFVIEQPQHHFFGANMAYRLDALRQLGGFRTDLGLRGGQRLLGEDTECFLRALSAGKRLVYAPRARVSHWVPKAHMTRRYFRDWEYRCGYSSARYRTSQLEPGRTVFGLPRWVWREALGMAAGAGWAYLRAQSLDGFRRELRMWGHLGYGRGLVELTRRPERPSMAIRHPS